MNRFVLDGVLTAEHKALDLYLEDDEDFVYIRRKGQVLPMATFSAKGATVTSITKEADRLVSVIEGRG